MTNLQHPATTLPAIGAGPYRVDTNEHGTVELIADGANGEEWLIASASFGPLDRRQADFRFLAAAPDMLAALKLALPYVQRIAATGANSPARMQRQIQAVRDVRAIEATIAAAEGRGASQGAAA
jgi:hypothetical protein